MTVSIERQKFTVPQLARLWGISTNKIFAFIRSGELRAINLASRTATRPRYSIDKTDIDAFEKSRQVVPDGGESTTKRLRRRASGNVREFF